MVTLWGLDRAHSAGHLWGLEGTLPPARLAELTPGRGGAGTRTQNPGLVTHPITSTPLGAFIYMCHFSRAPGQPFEPEAFSTYGRGFLLG